MLALTSEPGRAEADLNPGLYNSRARTLGPQAVLCLDSPLCVCVPCHRAFRILVPGPGIKPWLPAVEPWSPNHWTAREVPRSYSYAQADHTSLFAKPQYRFHKGFTEEVSFDLGLKGEAGFFQVNTGQGTAVKGMKCVCVCVCVYVVCVCVCVCV